MIYTIPGLPVSSIPVHTVNCHHDVQLELFEPMGHFEEIFIEAYHASNMMCLVRSLLSSINTHSFAEEIITSSNEVFIDFVSGMVVGIRKLSNPTRPTAQSNVIAI
jgi:hypothetical protein